MSGVEVEALLEGIVSGDRALIGRALTLVESSQPEDRLAAIDLLEKLTPHIPPPGSSIRIGITGIPGAGKSTLIDVLGEVFIAEGKKIAVLAVDPSSTKSGGSILGDKTRMALISNSPSAFVRPSPTAGSQGGATRFARESITILEAAGHDVVFLETVGVGQSELAAVDMVDFFVLVVIPGAGDELQGIKRGIVEMADMVVVNKADSKTETAVHAAVRDYTSALRLLHSRPSGGGSGDVDYLPSVLPASALKKTGLKEIMEQIQERHKNLIESGRIDEIRGAQKVKWFRLMVENAIFDRVKNDPTAKELDKKLTTQILAGKLRPDEAADIFFQSFSL